ncbi:MAG: histidine kinase [Gemmatimonadaceae bacterium]|nr:histidine kinase [Gemmatimonadaceae bacterium]
MISRDATTLVHLVGFVTGIVLYTMLAFMTLRSGARREGQPLGPRGDRIPLATALLGILWNCGALVIYGLQDFGVGAPAPWLMAGAFSALGFLPAVVVHSALRSATPYRGARGRIAAGYVLSAAAAVLQIHDALTTGVVPSRAALLMLTVGYGVIIALLVAHSSREPAVRRATSAAALAAFAVMAFHLSQHPVASDSWLVELAGHHASLPLAMVILYQDYRFALADLFLKRVLTLLALIVLWMVLYTGIAAPYILPRMAGDYTQPLGAGAMLALAAVTAMAYPGLRRWVARFVDRVVLRRADYASLGADLAARIAALEAPEEILDATCATLGPALSSQTVRWRALDDAGAAATSAVAPMERGQEAAVRISTADAPAYEITVGRLTSGRRLFSDDLAFLDTVALTVARRIDAVRMSRERYARDLREREILQLATEAELRALRAQLNPHFLFNTLTTIGHLIQEAPSRALETLLQLTGLLRAVLTRSDGAFVTLGEELEIVRAYLAIERARFEERLTVTIDVDHALATCRIPPLVLQPLVENAIKHGIAPRRTGGRVIVAASRGRDADELSLFVIDTGVGVAPAELARRRAAGIGLSNVARRLERYYGAAAALEIQSAVDVGTTVRVRIPIAEAGVARGAAPARDVA